MMHEQPGLVYVKLARRLDPDGSEEVILFEEWRDPPSVYNWAGPDLSLARLPVGAQDELLEIRIVHYEALDLDVDPLVAELLGNSAPPGAVGV